VWGNHTSTSSSSDCIATRPKSPSRNFCKHLRTIQRSNQKLWPFWAVIQVWRDETSASMNRDFIGTTSKPASWNSCKGRTRHRGGPQNNPLELWKKIIDFWHLVLLEREKKQSCLGSRHLVLWSLGTLTGQQRFYGSGLVT